MGKCVDKGYHPYVEITVCDDCVHHDMCETSGYLEENYCYDRCVGTPEQFAAWKKADDEGRLVELPCNVGECVYLVSNRVDGKSHVRKMTLTNQNMGNVLSRIGNDIYATREAAEAALEVQEGK